jgi:transposase
MNAYSKDLRIKALGALDREMPRKEAASTFGVSLATLKRWLKRRREGKDIAPKPSPGRTPRVLATPEQRRALWEQLEANHDVTLARHCELWEDETGVAVSVATMSRAVRRLGWTFKKVGGGHRTGRTSQRFLQEILAPTLKAGQIVLMDNLSVHKSKWVRELIEQRGCQLWLLPPYSLDFNPIEEAFSKVKALLRRAQARTLETLFEATEDARGYIGHCGYSMPRRTQYEKCSNLRSEGHPYPFSDSLFHGRL